MSTTIPRCSTRVVTHEAHRDVAQEAAAPASMARMGVGSLADVGPIDHSADAVQLEEELATFASADTHLILSEHFVQHPLTLVFHRARVERIYEHHHFKAHAPRMRMVATLFWILTAFSTYAYVSHWEQFPLYSFLALPHENTSPACFLAITIQTPITFVLLSERTRPQNYQLIVGACTILFVATFTDLAPTLQTVLFGENVEPLSDVATYTDPQKVTTYVAVHLIAIDLFVIGVVCTLGLEPLAATLSCVVCFMLLHNRSQWFLEISCNAKLPYPTLILHAFSVALLLFSCYFRSMLARRDFVVSLLLEVMKNQRIEQISREKERLDYERSLLSAQIARSSRLKKSGKGSSVSSEDRPEFPSTGAGVAGARNLSSCIASGPCVASRAASSFPASAVSSAADELVSMGALPSSSRSIREQLASGSLPLFPLLPQYYDEMSKHAENLPARVPEGSLQLRVSHNGKLVDSRGQPLARSKEMVGIFVLDSAARILLTFDWARTYRPPQTRRGEHSALPQPLHHSSLAAGAPVAAAGQMTVKDGCIISINNESGHYLPPPSCLYPVMTCLGELGVASLSSVSIEPIQTALTQTLASAVYHHTMMPAAGAAILRPRASPSRRRSNRMDGS